MRSPKLVPWTPYQYLIRRLIARSRKVSMPWDLYLEWYDHCGIWQAPRQQCCRRACQTSKQCDILHYQSRGLETSRDLTIRRLIGYWNRALVAIEWQVTWHMRHSLRSWNHQRLLYMCWVTFRKYCHQNNVIKWKHFPRYWPFGIITKISYE